MLNFDSKHDKIIGNKQQDKVSHRKVAIVGLLASITLYLTGCAETDVIDCNIEKEHAHKFESFSSFDTYISSEKEYLFTPDKDYYYRTEEYVLIDEEDKELLEFEKKHELFRIADNKDVIDILTSYQDDFLVYEYKKEELIPMIVGKATLLIPTEELMFTNDVNKENLTGNTKIAHYVYCGYKIVRNEKGKLEVVQSEYVNSLDELPIEYIYVKKEFYIVVDLNTFEEIKYDDDLNKDKTIGSVKKISVNNVPKGKIRRKNNKNG